MKKILVLSLIGLIGLMACSSNIESESGIMVDAPAPQPPPTNVCIDRFGNTILPEQGNLNLEYCFGSTCKRQEDGSLKLFENPMQEGDQCFINDGVCTKSYNEQYQTELKCL